MRRGTPAAQGSTEDGLPAPQRLRAILVLLLGITVSVLDTTLMNLALPDIARDMNASASQSIWVVNAYQIAALTLLLPLANVGDLLGHRRVYLAGMALFSLASLAAILAPNLGTLILARTLQGIGAAGIMSVNTALVRHVYPTSLLGRGIALNSMVVATASVAGPPMAALVLSMGSWPWLLAINLPLGLLVLMLGSQVLPSGDTATYSGAQIAPLDVILNILMFALIFVGVDRLGMTSGSDGPPARDGWMLLVAGVFVGTFYIHRQRKLTAPLFPVDLLRLPVFALSMGSSVGAFCAQMLAFVSLPFLLLESYAFTHWKTGLLISAWPLAIVAVAPLAGRLIGRIPAGVLGGIGMVMMSIGLALLAMLPSSPTDIDVAWRMALCGLGFGLFQSPNNHTIVTSSPRHRSGAAGGMIGTARLSGQTLGAILVAYIFSIWHPHANAQGPIIALSVGAVCALVASVCSVLRVRTASSS